MIPKYDVECEAPATDLLYHGHVVLVTRHQRDLVPVRLHQRVRIVDDIRRDLSVDLLLLVRRVAIVHDHLESLPFRRPPQRVVPRRTAPIQDSPSYGTSLTTSELKETTEVQLPAVVADRLLLCRPDVRRESVHDGADVHPLDPDVRVIHV